MMEKFLILLIVLSASAFCGNAPSLKMENIPIYPNAEKREKLEGSPFLASEHKTILEIKNLGYRYDSIQGLQFSVETSLDSVKKFYDAELSKFGFVYLKETDYEDLGEVIYRQRMIFWENKSQNRLLSLSWIELNGEKKFKYGTLSLSSKS